jgi:galacturan 1,4-alpha-galacturonidase
MATNNVMLPKLEICCLGLVAAAIPTVIAFTVIALAHDQIPLISVQAPETVTTTALPFPSTPAEHWTPSDRPDPYVPGGGAPYSHDGNWPKRSKTCAVKACGDPNGDDAPAILAAFDDCKYDGHIVFENTTYYVGTVMNTTGLQHVDIEINGTLLWSDDIEYWLGASLPIGFQNQTSAWFLGGDDIHFFGHGAGTLDGNGQVWYDCR